MIIPTILLAHIRSICTQVSLYNPVENTMSIGVNFCEIYIHCIGATPCGGASHYTKTRPHTFSTRLYKVLVDKTPNNVSVVCNSHYIHCLIKELGTHLATLCTSQRHLRKRKSWTIMGLVCVPVEFQPMIKKWIFRHATGFLKLHKCPWLYCWVYQLFHKTSFQIIIIHSISGQSRASELLCH